jgi:hypothetical protein
MSDLTTIIVDEFGLPENLKQSVISNKTVLDWMQSSDIEALGALYSFVMKANYSNRIKPVLTQYDYWNFLSRYFARCFREDPNGEWAHSRYQAGWDLANWITKLWKDQPSSSEILVEVRKWLGDLYREADAPLRRCIVDAALEHMFENKQVARFFVGWKSDQILAQAYSEALDWSPKDDVS